MARRHSTQAAAERRFLTITEVADELRVSRSTLYAHVRAGEIPYTRLGTRVLIARAALDLWLAERSVDADEAMAR